MTSRRKSRDTKRGRAVVYKASSIGLRSAAGTTSLRERQRLARGISNKPKPPTPVLVIRLVPELVSELAKRGAVEEIAAKIVGGVLMRGSIDQALSMWGDYKTDGRNVLTTYQRRRLKKKREAEKQNAAIGA